MWIIKYWSSSVTKTNNSRTALIREEDGYRRDGALILDMKDDVDQNEKIMKLAFYKCSCKNICNTRCGCTRNSLFCITFNCNKDMCNRSGYREGILLHEENMVEHVSFIIPTDGVNLTLKMNINFMKTFDTSEMNENIRMVLSTEIDGSKACLS